MPQTKRLGSVQQLVLLVIATGIASAVGDARCDGSEPLTELRAFLSQPRASRGDWADQSFATQSLSREQCDSAAALLIEDWKESQRSDRKKELEQREIKIGEWTMPFHVEVFGEAPATGRSLTISMHGGGGAPKRVNDQQWQNQKRLYRLEEGYYVAPRAPGDTWDLWHQPQVDLLFARLIENFILVEGVNPDRVYLMGYSAGGDGVYQLAPRMADRFAAAAMMAGHPNETSPLGLRNLPFTLHMGELDKAYDRNRIAKEWEGLLEELHTKDPGGYVHWVKIHEGKGHWMDRQDAEAIPWMTQHNRNITPSRILWKQDDVLAHRFYWLAIPEGTKPVDRALVTAEIETDRGEQTVRIQTNDVDRLLVRLRDDLVDLSKPVTVIWNEREVCRGPVERKIRVLATTLQERSDPRALFSAELEIAKPGPTAAPAAP
ncbi:Alpha/beta hydrolase family protein [Pirellula sp. SH-Sr6A]|uniref:alpha/beta hydrolase n=1 Tax=Pirellula sp. SH-Sr6A TaxID=1632865 RepID=UPI00078B22E1|nr:alpha/beta hydrolase [Pirellula sp. SH-Sr6A]AMV33045.1 Alpha/beta hydrolase family protein [Pirellula sp. SH-Sr6A]